MSTYKKINFHTHSTYCDGKNSLEEMVLSAIEKKFDALGFSGHCLFPLSSDFYKQPDDDWHIHNEDLTKYIEEIKQLKAKYSNQIEIYTGFEADFFEDEKIGSAIPDFKAYEQFNPDFLIGSVHFVNTPKGFYTVDHTVENIRENLKKLYGNETSDFIDGKKAVCEYFAAEREMLSKGNFSIIGHADLIRKRNGALHFFTENEDWYLKELQATSDAIAKAGVVVEINTGAIARGVMEDVYPSSVFLEMLFDRKVPVCINSDCHNAALLDCAFDKAAAIARKTGYKELIYPAKDKELIVKL